MYTQHPYGRTFIKKNKTGICVIKIWRNFKLNFDNKVYIIMNTCMLHSTIEHRTVHLLCSFQIPNTFQGVKEAPVSIQMMLFSPMDLTGYIYDTLVIEFWPDFLWFHCINSSSPAAWSCVTFQAVLNQSHIIQWTRLCHLLMISNTGNDQDTTTELVSFKVWLQMP